MGNQQAVGDVGMFMAEEPTRESSYECKVDEGKGKVSMWLPKEELEAVPPPSFLWLSVPTTPSPTLRGAASALGACAGLGTLSAFEGLPPVSESKKLE